MTLLLMMMMMMMLLLLLLLLRLLLMPACSYILESCVIPKLGAAVAAMHINPAAQVVTWDIHMSHTSHTCYMCCTHVTHTVTRHSV